MNPASTPPIAEGIVSVMLTSVGAESILRNTALGFRLVHSAAAGREGETMTNNETPVDTEQQVGALAERLFMGGIAGLETLSIHIGSELGLYTMLYDSGPSTVAEVARAAGIHERYAREWLEQQATAELIDVDDPARPADERCYSVNDVQAAVLVDPSSLAYLAPAGGFVVSFANVMPKLLDAYRTGGGVPYGDYGSEMRESQAAFNRPAFQSLLASDWITNGMPDIHTRLSEPGARILDAGCGLGWSTISLAQAYPAAEVIGIDLDGPSIERARQNAKEAGVDNRVTLEVADAADPKYAGSFNAVFILEAVHDLSRPVEVLGALRNACAEDGTVIVMDERVADSFGAIGDPVERFMYAASVLHCLPAGMAEQPSAGTGTVMRLETIRTYAADAGFTSLDVLPIEHDFFRFYRLEP
jgi:2-polyprenyl-3-methyl-5-hydroxy-6-metoxy-1,4-benzoquinol methylase